MTKVDAIYRLYSRGYYTAEQALAVGKRKLNAEEYEELELRIYPPIEEEALNESEPDESEEEPESDSEEE